MAYLAILLIKAYKRWLSPMLPAACRYYPTCSEYTAEAIELYGFFKGSWMGIRRIARCHPGYPGGFDPVPRPPEHKHDANNDTDGPRANHRETD